MDREKQIEEMAKITCSMYCRDKEKKCANVQECDMKCLHHQRCEALYNAGYRKQNIGEWIMVGEGITERVVCSKSNYKNPSEQLRKAYNRTLKNANFRGTASFCCGPEDNGSSYVLCQECPLNKTDCENKHDVKYWRQWWKELTGEEDNSEAKILSKEEAQEFFDSQLQKIDDIVDPKFRVVCSLLHQPEERILKSCVFGFVLEYLRLWYKEAIEWNSIAEGPVSNIPDDFKDIYLKVYDSGGNLILSDEYTLESKGLKKINWTRIWTRISENTPKT